MPARKFLRVPLLILLAFFLLPLAACATDASQSGQLSGSETIDKSGDAVLQGLIQSVRPKFEELEFTGRNGQKLGYWLFRPAEDVPG